MAKYRFKTEEEFRAENNFTYGCPAGWIEPMNKYLGTDIPDKYNKYCDENIGFATSGNGYWHFNKNDYVLKENIIGFKLEDVQEIKI